MKNFSLPSLLVGLVLGVVVGAGAMSLAGTNADNSDLQGRFGSLPSAEDLKEVDPDHLGGIFDSGGDCDITNCDLLVEIEEVNSLVVEASITLHNEFDDLTTLVNNVSNTLAGGIGNAATNVIGSINGDSSWTLEDLADHVYDVCN